MVTAFMIRRVVSVMFFVAAGLCAQTPVEGEPPGLLEEARQTAINYSKHLPDFICTELVHRYEASGPTASFRSTDTLTLQLSFFQLHENYKLIARNDRPTKKGLDSVGGAFSQGEFGSKLLLIFHPVSKAEFSFEEWSTVGDRPVAVYRYRVSRNHSHFELRLPDRSAIAGYHGEVFIDKASHLVLRVAESIDIPDGFPVQFSHNTEDYDFVDVSGHSFLLPVRCESLAADLPALAGRRPGVGEQRRYRNVIEFRDYRKYAAESTLNFDAPAGPPKQ